MASPYSVGVPLGVVTALAAIAAFKAGSRDQTLEPHTDHPIDHVPSFGVDIRGACKPRQRSDRPTK